MSSDIVVINIQMESLFKLYRAIIDPAIVYTCETWIKCEEVFNNNITIERLKQIVKFVEELNLKQ